MVNEMIIEDLGRIREMKRVLQSINEELYNVLEKYIFVDFEWFDKHQDLINILDEVVSGLVERKG